MEQILKLSNLSLRWYRSRHRCRCLAVAAQLLQDVKLWPLRVQTAISRQSSADLSSDFITLTVITISDLWFS